MAWGSVGSDATFNARLAAGVIRPAVFVYLDWPSGVVRASTHNRSVTTVDNSVSPAVNNVWSGVGNIGFIEAPEYKRNGAMMTYKLGLASLPQGVITDATEAAAIGRRAELYFGLADEGWDNWALSLKFIGHIITAGDFRHRRDQDGNWVTDASIEISNGRSPRRRLENYHSPATAEAGDTAWRLTPTVARAFKWPG